MLIVFGGGHFGRWFSPKWRAPMNEVSVLIRKTSESSLTPSAVGGPSKKAAVNQEAGSHQALHLLLPGSRAAQPLEL